MQVFFHLFFLGLDVNDLVRFKSFFVKVRDPAFYTTKTLNAELGMCGHFEIFARSFENRPVIGRFHAFFDDGIRVDVLAGEVDILLGRLLLSQKGAARLFRKRLCFGETRDLARLWPSWFLLSEDYLSPHA